MDPIDLKPIFNIWVYSSNKKFQQKREMNNYNYNLKDLTGINNIERKWKPDWDREFLHFNLLYSYILNTILKIAGFYINILFV